MMTLRSTIRDKRGTNTGIRSLMISLICQVLELDVSAARRQGFVGFSSVGSWFDLWPLLRESRLVAFERHVAKKRGNTTRFPTRIPAATSPVLGKYQQPLEYLDANNGTTNPHTATRTNEYV